MRKINVTSEIAPLKKVLLHRPGKELLNLTPDTLGRLLFDDIPFLPVAIKEHEEFAQILKDNGVEVVYLEDLMAEVLDLSDEIRDKFIKQFVYEAYFVSRDASRQQFVCLTQKCLHSLSFICRQCLKILQMSQED